MRILKIVYLILQIHFALSEDVLFHLYNRQHHTNFEIINNNWDYSYYSKEYKFIIHGFTSNGHKDWIINMKDEYLKTNDYNIIAVDWSALSGKFPWEYDTVKDRVEFVAKTLANYILSLQAIGVKLQNIHLIGHSLGAHIAGVTGKIIANVYQEKIGRITGLDPAGPGFQENIEFNKHKRITQGDAKFVDIIHTSGLFGFKYECGDCDFFVNDGYAQNGCDNDFIDNLIDNFNIKSCSHARAYMYFTESIQKSRYGFIATRCNSYADYTYEKCNGNDKTNMGEYVSQNARGKYYLQTGYKYAFAKNGTINSWEK